MNDNRIGILALALVCFLAGVTGGRLLALGASEGPRRGGPLADYEVRLVRHFELGPERERCLRVLLQDYARQVARVQNAHLAQSMSTFEPELSRLASVFDRLIREQVLPTAARAEFDRMSRPLPFQVETP
jgi:hypothetical protein